MMKISKPGTSGINLKDAEYIYIYAITKFKKLGDKKGLKTLYGKKIHNQKREETPHPSTGQ